MTKNEFVSLHGIQAWSKLVEPLLQEQGLSEEEAAADRHELIMMTLRLLDNGASGIREARMRMNGCRAVAC